MHLAEVLAIVAVNIGLIAWLRSDMKLFETRIESLISQMQKDTRDFHGRLCAIEERNRK